MNSIKTDDISTIFIAFPSKVSLVSYALWKPSLILQIMENVKGTEWKIISPDKEKEIEK